MPKEPHQVLIGVMKKKRIKRKRRHINLRGSINVTNVHGVV